MDLIHHHIPERIVIRHIGINAPFHWLSMAVSDMRRAPLASFFYGGVFVVMGYVLNTLSDHRPEYVVSWMSVFLLAGPFLSIGLYDVAHRIERRGRADLIPTLTAWKANLASFTLYAALLAVLVFAWLRASLLIFALFYTESVPTLEILWSQALGPDNATFVIAYLGVGYFFALAVFALSVVSIPMMLDREVDAITAMLASLRAAYTNIVPMVVWAGLIVGLTVLGFALYTIGLAFFVPLIALASWHAYRDLIEYTH